jgi:hypothetical protein
MLWVRTNPGTDPDIYAYRRARRAQISMVPARRGQMGQARPQQVPAGIGACFIYEYAGRCEVLGHA